MKKLHILMMLVFMLASFTIAYADTVQVGTGTATTSYLPLYGLYGYNYTQQIYTQTQIGVAGNITKVRFYYVSGTITNSRDWVIYMGHTTKTTFASTTDWEPLANLTQVFAGDVTSLVPLANNWMEITLTTPFSYNNTDNLIVAVDENTAGYASMSWGAFTSGTNTGIYYYSDTINPDPATPPTASSRTATIDRIQFVFPNSAAPLAPTLVAPANGGWSFTDGKLYWTPTAGGSDATTYDIYFGTAANPPLVSDNQVATNYTPTLAAATTYYWKVVASNEIGDSPASATWSFKTPTTTQVAESFEATAFPPAGWANGTTGTWSRNTSYYKHGVASANKYGSTTTAYVLSTPKVTIDASSTLDIWTLASSATGTLQVVYSPDRVTWTALGTPIAHAATYTWYNTVADLSSLAGNNYYLGIQTGLQSASFYVDLVVGPEITPEAPGVPVLSVPTDLAVNVNEYPTLTWTAPTTGGVPTGYRLYLDTNPAPTTLVVDQAGLSYTYPTALAYNTTYYWTVAAYNGAGVGPQATVRSFTTRQDPTIYTLPYTDGFEVDNTDAAAVASWSNVYVTGTKNWTANSSVTTYNRAPRTGTFNAFLGWSASTWMIRPVQLTGGTSYDVEVYARQDDADVALANMTIAYGTAGTAAAMTNVIVPQTGLTNGDYQRLGGSFTPASTGIYHIGILGTLPTSTNWYVSIDDITIRPTPAIIAPTDLAATNVDGDSAELSWTENNTPAAELWDIKYGAPGFDPATEGTPVSGVSTNPYTLTGLDPNTSYHWYVRSITGPVRDVSAWAGPGSFNTQQIPATLPFAEDWESGQDGWTFVNGAQTNAWYVGAGDATYTPYEGTSFAYISNNSGTNVAYTNTATSVTHIYRDIAFDAASVEFPLSFMWKCVGETTAWDKMRVYVVDTSVTPVAGTALTTGQVGLTNYNGQANWTAATITLPSTLSGTTKRVVFSWSNDSSGGTNPPINLDYINLTAVPVTSAPNPANLVSPLDDAINVPLTQTLNWSSGGGYVEGYRLSFGTVDPYAVIVNDVDLDMLTTYDPTLAYSTEYWWTVTPYNYLGDATSITEWSFTTRDDPTKPLPYVQNFDSGTSLALIDWTGTMYISANHGTNGTNGLTKNIYYTSDHDAVTPPIGPMTNGVELKFDYRIVDWSGYPGTATVLGASDNVQVQISTDSGTTYTPIHTINQANHVTSTAFATVTVPLTAYTTGNIMLKFLGTWGEGDYYLDIDNVSVMVPATAPEAPLLVYPGTDATDLPKTGFDLSWQNNPLGLEPDYFVVYMWTDAQGEFGGPFWETADASVTTLNPTVVIPEGETEPLTFAYDDRWNWTVSAVLGTTEVIADSRWFVIQSDPTITIPHTQSFGTDATPVWPSGWTQSYQDGVTSNRWTASATANAGGTANEMMCTWASGTGISRLITPPINTTGIANFSAQFNHYFNDFAAGATAKVQYSHDLNTWYDTNWTLASGGGDDLGLRTALVLGINQPITYVAWVVDGDHYQFDYWYVDDVVLDLLPTHDVAPISIFTPESEVVDALTPLTPSVQVANLGANAETFTVTATWDTYTNTQTVTNLGIGQTATVTFATFTPNTYAAAYFTVTTNLSTDVNTVNDVLQTALVTLPLDRPALASNLHSDYLVGFNLKDPGTLTDLIDKSAYQSLYAGDWMNGKWYACEDYDDVNLVGGNFWQIDPPAGTMTDLGDGTTSMHGLAWDDVNGVLYGHDAANLYTLNPATGAILTTVGPHGITYQSGETTYEGLVISIAYDNYTQTLYAVELGTASLYTLNVTTGAATKVGAAEDWLGIDVNYAQDMAFDQDTGLLYLAGYTNSTQGALYWIDTTYGYAWKVGPFQGSSEMDAFAIPYGDAFVGSPDVTIAADGTLSWPAINGAAGYYVYAADDPYGTYTKIATVYDLSWLDPNFPETMKFYQVVAFGGRAASNNQADVNINPTLRKTGTRAAGEVTASPADRNQRQLKK